MHACKVINQLPINFLLIDELVNRLFVSALHSPLRTMQAHVTILKRMELVAFLSVLGVLR